jgi:hypothetical protein
MDKVGLHDSNDLARSRIGCNQRIQGLWFTPERDHKPPTGAAHFSGEFKQFLPCTFLLGSGSVAENDEKGQE